MRERGNALVEFAMVVPLFVVLIYGALYLTDVGVFKLRGQEIARYGAFALAAHPLSAYASAELNQSAHNDAFDAASEAVQGELSRRYFDLDGASEREVATAGAWSKTMAAMYEPGDHDLRNEAVTVLPSFAQLEWADPGSALDVVLGILGIGGGTEDVVDGLVTRLHFNQRGQVTARAAVTLLPPFRPNDAATAHSLARVAREQHADLSEWDPRGQKVQDSGEAIATTLIADSWRVGDGGPVLPSASAGPVQNGVAEVSRRGIEALPGGTVLQLVLDVLRITEHLPSGVLAAFGLPEQDPQAHVVALPYTARREEDAFNTRGAALPGQVPLFGMVDGRGESGSTVEVFETLPLYGDPFAGPKSPMRDALNLRGNNYMGCPESQKRGCWE